MKPRVARPLFLEHRNLILEYNATGYVTQAGATASNTVFFRLNSIFDPDYSNVTRNAVASGYTMLSAIYQKYCVNAVAVSVTAVNTTSFSTAVVLTPADDISATNYTTTFYTGQYAARNGARLTTLSPSTGSRSMGRLTAYYKCNQVLGQNRANYVQNATTSFGANPSTLAYLAVSIGTLYDGALNAGNISFTIRMRFYVTVMDVYDNIWNS